MSDKLLRVGNSQYHLAVAGGCEAVLAHHDFESSGFATRYREVVLTANHCVDLCRAIGHESLLEFLIFEECGRIRTLKEHHPHLFYGAVRSKKPPNRS